MKKCHQLLLAVLLLLITTNSWSQKDEKPAKLVAGIAGPELLHAGINYRAGNSNLLGLNFGIGPTSGGTWPTISAEHRLYFGKNHERSGMKSWFCRQGVTFFPSAKSSQQVSFNLTVGKDLPFKKAGNGFTIDAGVFYLNDSEESSIILIRSLNLWPALRFQFYFGL